MKLYLIIPALIVIFDQITKFFVRTNMQLGSESVPVIGGLLRWSYHRNDGIAFGWFGDMGARWFLVVLSILIIIGFIYVIKTRKIDCIWQKLGLAFILGGAFGNLIDRAILGHVVDFIDFYRIGFPIFNIADIFVTVGAGLVITCTIVAAVREGKSKSESRAESDV